MNKTPPTKNDIYNKLAGFSAKELASIADFVDFMRHQKKIKPKKIIQLRGILTGQNIDLSDLEQFKKHAWEHVEKEFSDA